MKKSVFISKSVILPIIMAFLATGCGRSQDANEDKSSLTATEEQPTPAVADENTAAPFSLEKNYLGNNLLLLYPNHENWGSVKIEGQDAKKLFETLQLKVSKTGGNLVWNPSRVKRGSHISCYEESMISSPEKLEYRCSFYIEYRAGSVIENNVQVKMDKTVPELTQTYSGDSLMLIAHHPAKWGFLKLKGMDAKALFFTMSVEPTTTEGNLNYLPSKKKEGRDITCWATSATATPDKVEHACDIFINYSTGVVYNNQN
jgi:hypothetical protein